jgi:hypothetical protein
MLEPSDIRGSGSQSRQNEKSGAGYRMPKVTRRKAKETAIIGQEACRPGIEGRRLCHQPVGHPENCGRRRHPSRSALIQRRWDCSSPGPKRLELSAFMTSGDAVIHTSGGDLAKHSAGPAFVGS